MLQPLVQLAVYAFVFGYIFRQRLPGADAPGYVPFLVVVMWPWTAFAEAVSRGTTAIQDNASLIGKVALPRAALVLAPVMASFAIHGIGFLGLLLVMLLAGAGLAPAGLALMLPALALLFLFALGLALLLSALQVFVRDIAPALPQILMLWMFLSPVFYGRYVMPEWVRPWFDLNPMTGFAEYLRYALLNMPAPGLARVGVQRRGGGSGPGPGAVRVPPPAASFRGFPVSVLVEAHGLGKSYPRVFRRSDRFRSLCSLLAGRASGEVTPVLQGIDLCVPRGQSLGLIGDNGAGKSTLLKLLTGVLTPTHGSVRVNGRVGALLELGAGFHPEYTGRDNIAMAATLQGFSADDLAARLADIVRLRRYRALHRRTGQTLFFRNGRAAGLRHCRGDAS